MSKPTAVHTLSPLLNDTAVLDLLTLFRHSVLQNGFLASAFAPLDPITFRSALGQFLFYTVGGLPFSWHDVVDTCPSVTVSSEVIAMLGIVLREAMVQERIDDEIIETAMLAISNMQQQELDEAVFGSVKARETGSSGWVPPSSRHSSYTLSPIMRQTDSGLGQSALDDTESDNEVGAITVKRKYSWFGIKKRSSMNNYSDDRTVWTILPLEAKPKAGEEVGKRRSVNIAKRASKIFERVESALNRRQNSVCN